MNRYEFPMPVLDVSTDSLNIETQYRCDGQFTIKNTGGGTLEGHVLSRCPGLTFYPDTWKGNRQEIKYTLHPKETGLQVGQTVDTRCFITSNGGEIEFPVRVKIKVSSINTDEGFAIANLQDFYDYALEYPTSAQTIFKSTDFYVLLQAIGYEYMELYDTLHKDSNSRRALDNFFILSGLKGKTTISLSDTVIEFLQKPNDTTVLTGSFEVYKSDFGHVEMPIKLLDERHKSSLLTNSWLSLPYSKLSSSDFNENNVATISFSIDPTMIFESYASKKVVFGTSENENTIEIVYRRSIPLIFTLDRQSFKREDRGILRVINNTGELIYISPVCKNNVILFAAKDFPIGAVGEIPFEVKTSTFTNAFTTFLSPKKTPYIRTTIDITANNRMGLFRRYNKTLPVIIGEW